MKKIQLFLKYLVLMLFLIVWIIIMFFTDYMNSQSFKLYCMFVVGCGCAYSIWQKTYVPDARSYIAEKALALILIVAAFIRLLCFYIKKSKYVTDFSVAYFFWLFFYPHMLEYNQSSFSIATCTVVGTLITDMTICSVNM